MRPELLHRDEGDGLLPYLLWRPARPVTACSTAPVGGGLGERAWLLNAQVAHGYRRTDLDIHVGDLARLAGCSPDAGVGLLTAAPVSAMHTVIDTAASVTATVGVRIPTWAAAPTASVEVPVGTINLVAWVPEPLSPAALVNLVATITEAKTQALFERGVPGTGTASDAVCVTCPVGRPAVGAASQFGGPRSVWGARIARAAHAAVLAGLADEGST